MITTTISDFRKNIKNYLNRVTDNFKTLIINRGNDTGVVIFSLDESWEDYLYWKKTKI